MSGDKLRAVCLLNLGAPGVLMGWRQTRVERDKALQARAGEEAQRKAAQASEQKAEAREAEAGHLLYVADMNLGQQYWEQNNIARLRELLDETKDSLSRGFEWYYWQRQTHLNLKTLRGHLAYVSSVAFSPDGQRIVTGSDDKTAKVWDAANGRELLTLKGQASAVSSVAFSPNGQRIVTGSHDNTAKVWDAASGKELLMLTQEFIYVVNIGKKRVGPFAAPKIFRFAAYPDPRVDKWVKQIKQCDRATSTRISQQLHGIEIELWNFIRSPNKEAHIYAYLEGARGRRVGSPPHEEMTTSCLAKAFRLELGHFIGFVKNIAQSLQNLFVTT